MITVEQKKVKGSLVGVDGNAYALMAHFAYLARKQRFDRDWINGVIEKAKNTGSYEGLVSTLDSHMEVDVGDGDDE